MSRSCLLAGANKIARCIGARAKVKEGIGEIRWGDGSSYNGSFVNGALHGVGSYKWADGRVYDGQWCLPQD
eukprot:869525-Amphidinium_carterae.1